MNDGAVSSGMVSRVACACLGEVRRDSCLPTSQANCEQASSKYQPARQSASDLPPCSRPRTAGHAQQQQGKQTWEEGRQARSPHSVGPSAELRLQRCHSRQPPALQSVVRGCGLAWACERGWGVGERMNAGVSACNNAK